MALRTLLIILGYFLIRVCVRFSSFEETRAVYSTRVYKLALGIISFILGAVSYWFEMLEYDPCEWCLPPIPLWFFLGWLAVVVIDSLYQILMMNGTHIDSVYPTNQEESGAPGEICSTLRLSQCV